MEKNKYYVSVQSNSIVPGQGATPYEFEIHATPEEVDQLEHMFAMKSEADQDCFFRAHIPGMPYHLDDENDLYDTYLKEIYQHIYAIGTDKTKQDMREMGLIDSLEGLGEA